MVDTENDHEVETGSDVEELENVETDDLIKKVSAELRNFKMKFDNEEKKNRRGRPPTSGGQVSEREDRLVKVMEILVGEIMELKSDIKNFVIMQAESIKKISRLEAENECLKKSVKESEKSMDSLEDRLDKLEIEAREPFLVVSGRVVSSEGNFGVNTSALISDQLRISRMKTDSFVYSRLGKDSSKILVKVPTYEDKISLLKAARKIRPVNLYVNEFLSPHQDNLFYEVRKLKTVRGFHSVFSFKGRIYYTTAKNSKMILVKNLSDLK